MNGLNILVSFFILFALGLEATPLTAVRWTGYTDKIWNDQQCANLGNFDAEYYAEDNLAVCKKKCSETSSCTAINFKENGGCTLRQCGTPVPVPQWNLEGYKGYFIWENYEDVYGALGDGRIFRSDSADYIDSVNNIEDKNVCCAECITKNPETELVLHTTYREGVCYCLKSVSWKPPVTNNIGFFSGRIGNHSDESLDLGEGWAFNPQENDGLLLTETDAHLGTAVSPNYHAQADQDGVCRDGCYEECKKDCKNMNSQNNFFEFFQRGNNDRDCKCAAAPPGILPSMVATNIFTAVCGQATD